MRYTWAIVAAVARFVALVLGCVWLGVSWAFGYMRRAGARAMRYTWAGVSAGARFAALVLGHVWLGVSIAFGYMQRAVARAMRYTWAVVAAVARFVALVMGHLWLGVSIAFGYMQRAFARAMRYTGAGVSAGARFAALVLGHVWLGVSIAFGYMQRAFARAMRYTWAIVAAVARFVALVLGHVWLGVSIAFGYMQRAFARAMRYTWAGTSAVAQDGALVLGYVRPRIATAIHLAGLALHHASMSVNTAGFYTRQGIVTLAQAVSQGLRHIWAGVSTGLGYLRLSVTTLADVAGRPLRRGWSGITMVLSYVGLSVATVGRVVGVALRYTWVVGLAALGILWLGTATLLRPLWLGGSAILRHLWLGVSTAGLVLSWALGQLWRGVSIIPQVLVRSSAFVVRTVWTACNVVRDVLEAGREVAKHRKGVSVMSDFNLTRERLLSLVATALIFFLAVSVLIRVFWPAPPEPTTRVVHWATDHLMREGEDLRMLPVMAEEFNKAGHRTESGTRIVVEVHNVPSELQADYLITRLTTGRRIDLHKITDGYVDQSTSGSDPAIVTPSSAHWLVSVNHAVDRTVVDLKSARSIVGPVIGIVTYEEMARCLGWPEKEIGYADILALRADPLGWGSYDCPGAARWGQRPLVAFTDPSTSSTGRSLLLGLYSIAAGKPPEELTLEDIKKDEVVSYVKQFQGLIDHYLIGTTVLNTKIHQGPRYGHFFIMPEDNLIHLYDGTESYFFRGEKRRAPPISERMVMIYPKEGSMPRTNCACIVEANWVTVEQVEAAQRWIDFLLADEQQGSLMAAGFRPGTDLPLAYPISR